MINSTTAEDQGTWQYGLSWQAVLAGGVAAVSIQIVLSLLGLGLGFVTIQPSSQADAEALGFGAATWWFVTGLLSLLAGGWVAGRSLGASSAGRGVLHGVLSWCVVTVFSALLIGSGIGALTGGGLATLGTYFSSSDKRSEMMSLVEKNDTRAENVQYQLTAEGKRKAEDAAKATGGAAFMVFFALVLGALASGFGGSLGSSPYISRDKNNRR